MIFSRTHTWDVHQEDGIDLINLPAIAYSFTADQPLGWCRFRPSSDGGKLGPRRIGGAKPADNPRIELQWRRI